MCVVTMSRRDVRGGDYPLTPLPPPSKCAKFLYYTWKLCSVVFSHFVMISLVVAYCILGAVTFEKLEAEHEREVKKNISKIRANTTQSIWWMTRTVPLLNQTNWTSNVVDMLKDFENSILLEMKLRGWDGSESTDHIQWTFTGALFYSIIVITTIGYGHIAPKTQTGKVVTIFYAILGIPLMLLCLSNIGDVMASSFRFLYWRVCCYVCTRPPKRRSRHRHASVRRSVRGGSTRGSTRRRRPVERAHSDTDYRYRDSGYSSGRGRARQAAPRAGLQPRPRSQPPTYNRDYGYARADDVEDIHSQFERNDVDTYEEESDFPKISLPLRDLQAALRDLEDHNTQPSKQEPRSKSLPRPTKSRPDYGPRRDFQEAHYEFNDNNDFYEMHDLQDVDRENYQERKALEERRRNEKEYLNYNGQRYGDDDLEYDMDNPRPRQWPDRRKYRGRSEYYEREHDDYEEARDRREVRARSAVYDYERRWEDGRRDYGRRDLEDGRRKRLRRLQTVDDTRTPMRHSPSPERDDWSDEVAVVRRGRPTSWHSRQPDVHVAVLDPSTKEELKPVPIWLCVLLVASYIVVGTFLFKRWEGWPYLDAAYFCFITLTTIGFGDFVPAQGQTGDATAAVHSIALCSLYLLFGIALLAMSFNLVQEEVRANVAALATKLGIIKPKEPYSDDDESDY